MKQHIVDDPGGHRLQAVRQSDEAGAGCAGAPALLLVRHPRNSGRLGQLVESRCQVGRRQLRARKASASSPRGADARASRARTFWTMSRTKVCSSAFDMRCGIKYDDGVAFPVGGHRAGTAAAAPDLDTRAGIRADCGSFTVLAFSACVPFLPSRLDFGSGNGG